MSNIRPIGDPSLATAMLATFQSIDNARSAPAGISAPRWRILQCIAKAAPNVPTSKELSMCSGLNKAALAEHMQALRWKGLVEMGGYRLSPSAAEMVGIEQPYPPKDARKMKFADIRGRSGTFIVDEFAGISAAPELPLADIGPLPAKDTPDGLVALNHALAARAATPAAEPIFGIDLASGPDISIEALITFGADGKIAKIEPVPARAIAPLDPADVPACMRPDCTPPASAAVDDKQTEETNKHGRGSAAVARPHQGAEPCDPVAADGISEVSQVRILPPAAQQRKFLPAGVVGNGRSLADILADISGEDETPAPAPATPRIRAGAVMPAQPWKPKDDFVQRQARLTLAIAFLKGKGILVTPHDRDALVRKYWVTGSRFALLAEEVIEIAIAKGWAE